MNSRRFVPIALLTLALLLTACGGGAPATLVGTSWRMVSIDGLPLPEDVEPTLIFDDETQLSGFAGCNSFSGSYTVTGGKLVISDLISTDMACDSPRSDIEARYFEVMAEEIRINFDGGLMTLHGLNRLELGFEPQS